MGYVRYTVRIHIAKNYVSKYVFHISLHIQNRNSVVENRIEIDDHLDQKYKPGLYNQVTKFLADEHCEALLEIQDLVSMNSYYDAILLGGEISCGSQ